MNAEQIEWLRGWAAKNECRLEIQGEVGFGRPCVGIIYPGAMGGHYLSYEWYGMAGDQEMLKEVNQIVHQAAPPDAYHKDELIAVLGEGYDALDQLYQWVKAIDEAGLTTEECEEPDLGAGTTTIHSLVFGKRAKIRRICRA